MILQNIFLLLILGDVKEIKARKKIQYHWAYQLIFIPHKKITCWFYIKVMGVMTKTCTIRAVTIYTSLQRVICQDMMLRTNPRSHTTWNFYCNIFG